MDSSSIREFMAKGPVSPQLGLLLSLVENNADINTADASGITILMVAAHLGNTDLVQCLLNSNAGINRADNQGKTALMRASAKGHYDVTAVLLDHGAHINNQSNKWCLSALMEAATNGHINVVNLLIHWKARLNMANHWNETALMLAVKNKHSEVVTLLVRQGADVNKADMSGQTALMHAMVAGIVDIASVLLTHGADVNLHDKIGETALSKSLLTQPPQMSTTHSSSSETDIMKAQMEIIHLLFKHDLDLCCVNEVYIENILINLAAGGYEEAVCFLLEAGVDADVKGTFEATALEKATKNGHSRIVGLLLNHGADSRIRQAAGIHERPFTSLFMLAVETGVLESVSLILDLGADVNEKDDQGKTALMKVCKSGKRKIVQLLLDKGVDLNITNRSGQTALMFATECGDVEIVQMLLDNGNLNVNETDTDGKTALMVAAEKGHTNVVELLLDHNASVNATDKRNRRAMTYAAANGHENVVRLLLDTPSIKPAKSLLYAAEAGKDNVVRLLLTSATLLNAEGGISLRSAVNKGHTEVVRLLLEHGVDANYDVGSNNSLNLLMRAVGSGDPRMVNLFLKSGAHINKMSSVGKTALCYASQRGDEDTVQLLIEGGADVNMVDNQGRTALIIASKLGYIGPVRKLLEGGADVNVHGTMDEDNALLKATANGHEDVVSLLLEHGADINLVEPSGMTALFKASEIGRTDIVQRLLDTGADANIPAKRYYGTETALMEALRHDEALVKLLLEHGVNVNWVNDKGMTALMYAVSIQTVSMSTVRLLLENGGDLNQVDVCGVSPLIYLACRSRKENLTRSDIEECERILKTCLDFAQDVASVHCQKVYHRVAGEMGKSNIFRMILTYDLTYECAEREQFSTLCDTLARVNSKIQASLKGKHCLEALYVAGCPIPVLDRWVRRYQKLPNKSKKLRRMFKIFKVADLNLERICFKRIRQLLIRNRRVNKVNQLELPTHLIESFICANSKIKSLCYKGQTSQLGCHFISVDE